LSDTLQLTVTGLPSNKPGILLRALNQTNGGLGSFFGEGISCVDGQVAHSQVHFTGSGTTTFTDFQGSPFGAASFGAGTVTNYQFWYRDSSAPCSGSNFNLSSAWAVTWLP
jgi:hypothetical protein